jgi:hypothetical protein
MHRSVQNFHKGSLQLIILNNPISNNFDEVVNSNKHKLDYNGYRISKMPLGAIIVLTSQIRGLALSLLQSVKKKNISLVWPTMAPDSYQIPQK